MKRIGLDGFETGTNNRDDFVAAVANHVGERSSETALIVSDKNAHMLRWQKIPCQSELRVGNRSLKSRSGREAIDCGAERGDVERFWKHDVHVHSFIGGA